MMSSINRRKRILAMFAVLIAACLILLPSGKALANQLLPVANPGFEMVDDELMPESWEGAKWVEEDSYIWADDEVKYEGNYSLCVESPTENDARAQQEIRSAQQAIYKISAMVKTEGVSEEGRGASLSVDGTFAYSPDIKGTQDWQEVALYGRTVKGQDSITIMCRIGGYGELASGKAWFDDVKVEQVDSVPAGATVQDLTVVEAGEGGDGDDNDIPPLLPDSKILAFFSIIFVFLFIIIYKMISGKEYKIKDPVSILVFILAIALILRLIGAVLVNGYPNDIGCWKGWSISMWETGPAGFYTSGQFADYPPGYMYVLWILGGIRSLFDLDANSVAFTVIVKLPSIITDLVIAILIYRWTPKNFSRLAALALAAFWALNPAIIFNSGYWGQIDSILTLLLLVSLYNFMSRRRLVACLVFAAALLIKPQALLFGPVLLFLFIKDILDKEERKRAIIELLLGIVASMVAFFLLILPFKGTQEYTWIFEKYFSTATQYNFASVNAFNIYSLFGQNWVEDSTVFLFMSYKMWGFVLVAILILFSAYLFFKSEKREMAYLIAAFMLIGIYMLAPNMHERYYYPALLLLIVAYFHLRDRRILYLCLGFSTTLFAGEGLLIHGHILGWEPWLIALSLANTILFIYAVWVVTNIVIQKGCLPGFIPDKLDKERDEADNEDKNSLLEEYGIVKKVMVRKDYLLMAIITVVYTVFAFINLGSTVSPETQWKSQGEDVVVATLDLGAEKTIASAMYFGGIGEGNLDFEISSDNTDWTSFYEIKHEDGEMYKWRKTSDFSASGRYVRITSMDKGTVIYEVCFRDEEGNNISPVNITVEPVADEGSRKGENANFKALEKKLYGDASAMFDEQDKVPEFPSYYNSMYFDEIYHARTAYEHINGLAPFENSHPPLGKVFISIGISVFGMNPFGWRIIGTLFGIAYIPIMYILAKRIFKKTKYAFWAAVLMGFDFMHFAQTRISTVDVYGVFFIMLMTYFMYRYREHNYNREPISESLKPLIMCGVMMSLGCASKWICIYSGVGIAILLFESVWQRYREKMYADMMIRRYRRSLECKEESDLPEPPAEIKRYETAADEFWSKTGKTALVCLAVFIILPLVVYLLSYLPYILCVQKPYSLKDVWGVQEFMFNYHSNLKAGHPFMSAWYTWPVDARPILYFNDTVKGDMVSAISSFGNPAVWWAGFVCVIVIVYKKIKGRTGNDKLPLFLIISMAAQFLPWLLVNRATFIYHYFASVPFVILITVYVLREIIERTKKRNWIMYVHIALVVVLFLLYYPVISGMPVPRDLFSWLKLFPSWSLF